MPLPPVISQFTFGQTAKLRRSCLTFIDASYMYLSGHARRYSLDVSLEGGAGMTSATIPRLLPSGLELVKLALIPTAGAACGRVAHGA